MNFASFKNLLIALISGFLFSIGLGISGMTLPHKVIGFLDVFGEWDASLIFVMIGAIGIHSLMYRFIRQLKAPVYSVEWNVSERHEITPSLVIGSALFGIGWGMAGYCPGPALVSLVTFEAKPALFIASMIAGMIIFNFLNRLVDFRK
jgi:uncharacterized protein